MLGLRRGDREKLVTRINHLQDLVIRIFFRSCKGSVSGHKSWPRKPQAEGIYSTSDIWDIGLIKRSPEDAISVLLNKPSEVVPRGGLEEVNLTLYSEFNRDLAL